MLEVRSMHGLCAKAHILEDLSFQVHAGEVVSLL